MRIRRRSTSSPLVGENWWEALDESADPALRSVRDLSTLHLDASNLTWDQRELILDKAIEVLDSYYAHLPVKRTILAIDPIQKLRLMKYRLAQYSSDYQFHSDLSRVFLSLRDLHTRYLLPPPFRDSIAVLPFRVERYYHRREAHHIVAGVAKGFSHSSFVPGVEITHWNSVPISRAIEASAEINGGANRAARISRGLAALTTRPLAFSPCPDEDWVTVTYLSGEELKEYRTRWGVFALPGAASSAPSSKSPQAFAMGVDRECDLVQRTNLSMYAPASAKQRAAANLAGAETFPGILSHRTIEYKSKTYGYIRIFSFNVPDADKFVEAFRSLLQTMPKSGLIIDIRDNPGGVVEAGERLLQFFSSKTIEPARLQFRNSAAVLNLCKKAKTFLQLRPYAESVNRAVESGAVFSIALPLTSPAISNSVGKVYHGNVVLITSSRSYSTADFFAAGFQDHELGTIIGTDDNTGAGGGNVWTDDLLTSVTKKKTEPQESRSAGIAMPRPSFSFAIRRAIRTGKNSGEELEDVGVLPDKRYYMSKKDLLEGNEILIRFAVKQLDKQLRNNSEQSN